MAMRIQIRRDTAANWASVNPVLADGEVGLESDTLQEKVGNGILAWTSLPYRASYTLLSTWAAAEAWSVVSVTRDTNGAPLTASILWPDGTPGVFTADAVSAVALGALDAFHVTYAPVGGTAKTITQPAITRDAQGAVSVRPALVFS